MASVQCHEARCDSDGMNGCDHCQENYCQEHMVDDARVAACWRCGQDKGLDRMVANPHSRLGHRKPDVSRGYVGSRLRFKVLERDDFMCQYCGASAPKVELHVDHIKAKSLGGTEDMANLVAACVDCNLGKSDMPTGFTRDYHKNELSRLVGVIASVATMTEGLVREMKALKEIDRPDVVMSVEEAARMLSCQPGTVDSMRKRGLIRGVKLTGKTKWAFMKSEIRRYIDEAAEESRRTTLVRTPKTSARPGYYHRYYKPIAQSSQHS